MAIANSGLFHATVEWRAMRNVAGILLLVLIWLVGVMVGLVIKQKGRFSTRDLTIFMTLFSVVLGLAVYVLRR